MRKHNLFRFALGCFIIGLITLTGSFAPAEPPVKAKEKEAIVMKARPCRCLADTKVITFYENHTIPAGIGISTGVYTDVDGYRFINIFVEFEQLAADEKPVSLGVMFAFTSDGKQGSRRYFNFEQNFTGTANPQMITLSGEGSWHGAPHNRSTYIARLPVMGPYVQVFPFNHEAKDRKITIKAYLTT
ncbi:MAG: hypothetical protein ACK4Z9_06565 [Thermodesulfovibrionales bacterium]